MKREFTTYEGLIEIGEANQNYLENKYSSSAKATVEMAWQALDRLQSNIPQIEGGFGLGYPFHSMNDSFETTANPEFTRYSEEFLQKATIAKAMSRTAIWPCSPCQQRPEYTPSDCSSCTISPLKPREVMRALPDLDMFLISGDIAPATLANIENTAHAEGISQSDFDATGAIERVEETFSALAAGRPSSQFLPVDIHVIQTSSFYNALETIKAGQSDTHLPIRSMYAGWKANQKIDFWFDFVFSGTFNPDLCAPEMIEAVNSARQGLTARYHNHEIENLVRSKSSRASVLLDHPPTRQLFWDKLNRWRAND